MPGSAGGLGQIPRTTLRYRMLNAAGLGGPVAGAMASPSPLSQAGPPIIPYEKNGPAIPPPYSGPFDPRGPAVPPPYSGPFDPRGPAVPPTQPPIDPHGPTIGGPNAPRPQRPSRPSRPSRPQRPPRPMRDRMVESAMGKPTNAPVVPEEAVDPGTYNPPEGMAGVAKRLMLQEFLRQLQPGDYSKVPMLEGGGSWRREGGVGNDLFKYQSGIRNAAQAAQMQQFLARRKAARQAMMEKVNGAVGGKTPSGQANQGGRPPSGSRFQ